MTTGTSEIYAGVSFAGSRLGIDNFRAAYKTATLDRQDLAIDLLRAVSDLAAYPKLDFLYLPVAHGEPAAALNLVNYQVGKLSKSASGLTFAVDGGYTGDGVVGMLSTGLMTQALKMSQNDMSFGCCLSNGGAGANTNVAIALGASAFLIPRSGPSVYRIRAFGSATTDVAGYSGTIVGHWWARRNNAINFDVRSPDGVVTNLSQASSAPSGEVTLLGSVSASALRSTGAIKAAWGGRYLDNTEIAALTALIDGWFTSIA